MHALSLYLDTSVIGGCFDPEFMADTRALWRLMQSGRFRFVTSQVVIAQLRNLFAYLRITQPLVGTEGGVDGRAVPRGRQGGVRGAPPAK